MSREGGVKAPEVQIGKNFLSIYVSRKRLKPLRGSHAGFRGERKRIYRQIVVRDPGCKIAVCERIRQWTALWCTSIRKALSISGLKAVLDQKSRAAFRERETPCDWK